MQWQVSANESGLSLQAFVKLKLKGSPSQKLIKLAIQRGACELNHLIERFSSTRVGTGDKVCFNEGSLLNTSQEVLLDPSRILFENSIFFAYDKPSGIDYQALLDKVLIHDPSLVAIHRLDKDTSGVILFAKGRENSVLLEECFRKRAVQKTYLALADGLMKNPIERVKNFLAKKSSYQGQSVWGEVDSSQGVLADSLFECIGKGKDCCLVRCSPKTGRTHQLRVHLCSLGHPILGDYQYGKQFRCPYRPARQMLHAYQLEFQLEDDLFSVVSPVPEDFILALQANQLAAQR